MGSAVGAAYLAGGRRVVTTVAGRSARTQGLAERAGIELLPDLDAVVAAADLVLSIAPPDQAQAIAAEIAAAAERTGARPLVSDWNAVAPATVRRLGETLAAAGLELVDGSISGGPPRADYRTRVYLSGRGRPSSPRPRPLARRACRRRGGRSRVGGEDVHRLRLQGLTALLTHALVTADAHGVLTQVLDDLHDSFPRQLDSAARLVAVSATKAGRYVGEMREIAGTQASAGLTPVLFDAFAEAYEAIAATPAAAAAPEEVGEAALEGRPRPFDRRIRR